MFLQSLTPTPSVKRTMRRCGNIGRFPEISCYHYISFVTWVLLFNTICLSFSLENDTFVVWEMFPGNDGALSESLEEEDFYFSDNDWWELKRHVLKNKIKLFTWIKINMSPCSLQRNIRHNNTKKCWCHTLYTVTNLSPEWGVWIHEQNAIFFLQQNNKIL